MKKIGTLFLFLVFILSGCYKAKPQETNSQKQPSESKQVVENYFKYYNDKNKEGVNSTLTKPISKLDENIKYIKITSISEDTNPSLKENYFKYDKGATNGIKEENLKFYKVDFKVKYKKNIEPYFSGENTWWFTVIRKDKNSYWLIDAKGEG